MVNPVSTSPLLPLQVALYGLLSAELSVPVYDFIPEDAAFPYVVLGECTELPDNDHGQYGSEVTYTFHVWTEAEGYASGLEIVDEISRILDHQKQNLSPTGHLVVSIRRSLTRTMRDPNPRLRHIPVMYRICTEQIMEGS
jgi:hypothetical protein